MFCIATYSLNLRTLSVGRMLTLFEDVYRCLRVRFTPAFAGNVIFRVHGC